MSDWYEYGIMLAKPPTLIKTQLTVQQASKWLLRWECNTARIAEKLGHPMVANDCYAVRRFVGHWERINV
jgi:hypothetical protein